jgi:hypothetical protein
MSEKDNKDNNSGGSVKSTVDGTPIKTVFDYGDITKRDKEVVTEVIEFIKTRPGVPGEMLIEELKLKFQIVEIPMMDMKTSIWYQLTKDEKIGFAMQGYRETADKDGKRYRIPHIGFSADLDYLDDMAQRLAKKIMTITKESNETDK